MAHDVVRLLGDPATLQIGGASGRQLGADELGFGSALGADSAAPLGHLDGHRQRGQERHAQKQLHVEQPFGRKTCWDELAGSAGDDRPIGREGDADARETDRSDAPSKGSPHQHGEDGIEHRVLPQQRGPDGDECGHDRDANRVERLALVVEVRPPRPRQDRGGYYEDAQSVTQPPLTGDGKPTGRPADRGGGRRPEHRPEDGPDGDGAHDVADHLPAHRREPMGRPNQ